MNLERFEHELLKLKKMVGPEFVGCAHYFADGKGGHCIMGQIMLNCGVPEERLVGGYAGDETIRPFYGRDETGIVDAALNSAVILAVDMNNSGVPWHQIVDAIVPQTRETEVLAAVAV